jgi:RNA binding exosome subunit
MKPLGMTPFFQIVHATRAEDKVWEAVEEAIDGGMTPAEFRSEAADAWEQILRDRGKEARKQLEKLRGPSPTGDAE